MAIIDKSAQTLFHGWGFVEGHWVYVPLWDPSPVEKYKGFKQLQLASAIDDIAKHVSSKVIAAKLKGITKELIVNSGKSSLVSWEEGDGICPDNWPWHFPKGGGGGDPDPNPVYFPIKDLSDALVSQLAGHLLGRLGQMTKNRDLLGIAKELTGK